MQILSKNNDKIKDIKKLYDKKQRDKQGLFIVEGYHLVEEAYKKNVLETVITTEEGNYKDINTINTTKDIIKYISDVPSPQNILAICKKTNNNKIGNKILMLDNVQDPGNLGTLIRSALAFNIDTIIVSKDTVDLYNPKVIRSTQGTLFNINIIKKDLVETIDVLKKQDYTIIATKMENGIEVSELVKPNKFVIVLGNEGNGISENIIDKCDDLVYIKMNHLCESLNVAVAGSIAMYELSR